MSFPIFDRSKILMKPLKERLSKKLIERDLVDINQNPKNLTPEAKKIISQTTHRIITARKNNKPVIIAFGAHTIKNGLAPVLIKLMEDGWLTHLATNGAGIIHDWEIAFQGKTSEDVKKGVERGEFGNWFETGFYINLAINVGAYEGMGYGESVGVMIEKECLKIPSVKTLEKEVISSLKTDPSKSSVSAELLAVLKEFNLKQGTIKIPHPFKKYSVQASAYRLGIPFTGHPMIGHDIIYNHPMNNGALLGRSAITDFLTFTRSVSKIDGGVYLSLGSAVMSPMIFEKSLSMSRNLAIQEGRTISNYFILVVDLAKSSWDWQKGEPPEESSEYYLRFNKTFSRMGGTMRYLSIDNRDFLLALYQNLHNLKH